MKTALNITSFLAIIIAIMFSSCTESPTTAPGSALETADRLRLEQTALQDYFVASEFTPLNDNETSPAEILAHRFPFGGRDEEIKLIRKTRHTGHSTELHQTSDTTAELTIQHTTSGEAIIKTVVTTDSSKTWSVIRKPLEEEFTRKILFFYKASHEDDDDLPKNEYEDNDAGEHREKSKWKKFALSLLEGGTRERSARITEVSVAFSDTTRFTVTSPLNYYLYWKKFKPLLPRCRMMTPLHISVHIESSKPQPDIVLVRRGNVERGIVSLKKQLTLTTETFADGVYKRVYEITLSPHEYQGGFHSVVEVWTNESLFDSTSTVSTHIWSMPYFVQ